MKVVALQSPIWVIAALVAGWLSGMAANVAFAKGDVLVYHGERLFNRWVLVLGALAVAAGLYATALRLYRGHWHIPILLVLCGMMLTIAADLVSELRTGLEQPRPRAASEADLSPPNGGGAEEAESQVTHEG